MKAKILSFLAVVALLVGISTPALAQNHSSVQVLNGSCSAPSLTFFNDSDTGFYLSSAGVVGVCIGGTQVATINSSGLSSTVTGAPVIIRQQTSYSGTASQQGVESDFNISGTGVGKTGGYIGGVMGHGIVGTGTTAAGNNASHTFGVFGKISGPATGYTPGYKVGGVIGEASRTADCAICAVASDSTDQLAITVDALFGVDHQFGFAGSAINWGLDLMATAHDVYTPEAAYQKADIRLNNEVCILVGSSGPTDGTSGTGATNCGRGSIYLDYTATGSGLYQNTGSKASPVWTSR